MGIPYWDIPIRTIKTKTGWRLGKHALMGFLEKLDETVNEEVDDEIIKAHGGKGQEEWRSGVK